MDLEYLYDATGRRVSKKNINHTNASKSFERHFVYDGAEIIVETDGNNNVLAKYTHSALRTDDILSVRAPYQEIGRLPFGKLSSISLSKPLTGIPLCGILPRATIKKDLSWK
ncbi:MAG: hypothetical protein HN730_06135 [Bdellovibrionales bacterium]|nr:hypothetical protein [Bdellovibrionales bacterium]